MSQSRTKESFVLEGVETFLRTSMSGLFSEKVQQGLGKNGIGNRVHVTTPI